MRNYAKDEDQTRCCQAFQKDGNREVHVQKGGIEPSIEPQDKEAQKGPEK